MGFNDKCILEKKQEIAIYDLLFFYNLLCCDTKSAQQGNAPRFGNVAIVAADYVIVNAAG